MPNGINDISPNLRDWLLNKNLILADAIQNSGLASLAAGLGRAVEIETLPNAVQQSEGILNNGQFYRDLNLMLNPYKSDNANELIEINTNTVINIGNLPPGISPVSYLQNVGSNNPDSDFNVSADEAREQMLKNKYYDDTQLLKVNLNSVIVSSTSNGVYDYKSSIIGRSVDALLNATNLGGVAQLGNNVGASSPLVKIANQEVVKHFGYNAAFGLAQETLGHVNLNPLSLLHGNDIIVPNYQITIPKGQLATALDFGAKVLGFEIPKSLLDASSSIFATESPGITNTDRINAMVLNTGKGQVLALIDNISQNKYKPTIIDDRKRENITKGDTGTDGQLYAFDNGQGGILNLLDAIPSNDNANGVKTGEFEFTYGKLTSELTGGFNNEFDDLANKDASFFDGDVRDFGEQATTKFTWNDDKNKKGEELGVFSRSDMKNPKSLLYKTQALFNSNKTRNLITAKGDILSNASEIETGVSVGANTFISKGSGVKSAGALQGAGTTPEEVFCRVWTTFDRYNQVQDLQKNTGINENIGLRQKGRAALSVMGNNSDAGYNGFVKISPYKSEPNVKKFMFSIENLAWSDKFSDLPDCEKGPGDPITGTKGRIMWFPPYDISFSESTSVNWDTTNFIGRGEPIYTYNNTERSGSLSFKIIIDYATYMNDLKISNVDNDVYASIAAGCLDFEEDIIRQLSKPEMDKIDVQNSQKPQVVEAQPSGDAPTPYKVYFPNDSVNVPSTYEDGIVISGDVTYSDGYTFMGCNGASSAGQKSKGGGNCSQPNRTDYGLNSSGQTLTLPNGNTYNGWLNSNYLPDMVDYLVKKCPSCRINISGWASSDGKNSSNQRLSKDRATYVQNQLIPLLVAAGDPLGGKRFSNDPIGKGEANVSSCPKFNKTTNKNPIDCECKKQSRFVQISFIKDVTLEKQVLEAQKEKIIADQVKNLSQEIKARFMSECNYFEKIGAESPVIFDRMSEKISFFHPSFHSTTPEGFNSRLNFLQQCTRQGPTTNTSNDPSNLAFGKAPVCILRIGDFYNTKIVIDNIDFSFEPLVWDLNPEGIGVQPMIANVNMSFKFIGGSSLQGPINKLQNAVSFNFFANTEIYDTRSDIIINKGAGKDGESNYQYQNGFSVANEEELKRAVIANSENVDQIKRAEVSNNNTEKPIN